MRRERLPDSPVFTMFASVLFLVVAMGAVHAAPVADSPVFVSIDNGTYTRSVSYEGQSVLRCDVHNVSHDAFETITTNYDIMGSSGHASIDVRTTNEADVAAIHALIGTQNCVVHVADLESAIRAFESDLHHSRQRLSSARRNRRQINDWFAAYHTYPEIIQWYTDIADDFPLITKLVPSIGRSTEGRDMPALHIVGTAGGAKKKVYFQCQIHAREWISGATCMYVVNYLANNYKVDDEVTRLLDEVELIVVPFVNPDGYVFTWSGDRLWRKSRNVNVGSTCMGTDLNRNYDEHWGQGGSSSNPCSDTYMGTKAESAVEVQVTTDYFKLNAPIYGGIDWHSYSQLILRPWGWTQTDAPDEALLKQVGDLMADSAERVHGTKYTSQKSISLYPTTGTANDWFYGEEASKENKGVRAYGFTIELRDTGRYGFELPANEIIPQGQEMIPAAIDFMQFTTANPLKYAPSA